jgi:Sulfotransferase domain
MPDHFVIIGAQRCGTSYLSRLLDEHPGIEMAKPFRPQPKFFLDKEQVARGLDFYENRFFSDDRSRVRGETSTSYIESELALQRIAALLPQAPVVVVVRDPVSRAVSNHRFSTEHGVEHLPLAEGLRADAGAREWDPTRFSVSPFAYLARGRYADYLERVARHIPRERVRVLVFEELVSDPGVLAALYEQLGVDPAFTPAGLGTGINASAGDEVLDDETEAWLRDYFAEPNRCLAEFLGRELPWARNAVTS